jgi:hypothetical protein
MWARNRRLTGADEARGQCSKCVDQHPLTTVHVREPIIVRGVQWVSEKWETKMAADPNNGVRYLFRGRIADFGRTRTFVAIIAFIFGMTVGHTIANVANLYRNEAIRAQLDELRIRIDSLKVQSDAQKK